MENRPLVSVIVPVYNAEAYLEECLKSVQEQTYRNLEILVVDDGSTDRSLQMCDEFAKRDSRIKVVYQKNQGVAEARKNGVLHAQGGYICFADADDQMHHSMVESLVKNIGKCDLITAGYFCEKEDGSYIEEADAMQEGIYDTEKSMRYLISNMLSFENRLEYGVLPYLWNKMFKTKILKEVMEGIYSSLTYAEDVELLFQYILRCKRIHITHRCLYYYRYRNSSLSRSKNKNYMCDLHKIYLALENAFKDHPQEEILMHQLQLFVTTRIYAIAGYMGFSADTQMICYAFPFPELAKVSKIILYGAGRVGMDYYRQIFRRDLAKLVLWVDKRWKEYQNDYTPVYSPEGIEDYEYDYIIIAVTKRELADEIREQLVQKGIGEEKVLWRMPVIAVV